VIEARNQRDEQFGLERLELTVRQAAERPALEIVAAITAAVSHYAADVGGPEDDLTVSIVKVL
jgi:hypothetical protein